MESFKKESLGERESDWDGEFGYKPIGGVRARRLYNSNDEDAARGQRGRRRHFSKSELLSGNWLYIVDNDLPLTLSNSTELWEESHSQRATTRLCQDCKIFRLLSKPPQGGIQGLIIDLGRLRRVSNSCDLCELFLRCLTRHAYEDIDSLEEVEVYRDCSFLKMTEHTRPFLRLIGDPASKTPSAKTQIGLPILPDAGSQDHFTILRGWLHVCDKEHENYGCHSDSKSILPTRVIDVGRGEYSDFVRLYCSKKVEVGDYVALSHCWGKFSDEERALFCTFKENIDDRISSIEISKLPKTFRDAIRVTRELGQRYLWIDSLCIIQNDAEDWRREANTMEMVYSMAYFTIAATSAENSTQGFLKPRRQAGYVKIEKPPTPPPPPEEYDSRMRYFEMRPRRPQYKIYTTTGNGILTDIDGDRAPPEVEQFPLYVCEHIDDFTGDVEESILNSRGWVFQERALSRRILHFSATQTYWECGIGVHCETLTMMYNSKTHMLGDPKFPESTGHRTSGQNIPFVQSLFKQYMQRDFTQPTDRAIAFAGLEKRLAKAFDTEIRFGIIKYFLHRTLLFRPSDSRLTRTCADSVGPQEDATPTWSWMAYEGRIDFLQIDPEMVAWNEAIHFRNNKELVCCVRGFEKCRMKREGVEFIPLEEESNGQTEVNDISDDSPSLAARSWLRFDVGHMSPEKLKCVVVGRKCYGLEFGKECYILVVKPSVDTVGSFERVGVGSVDLKFISWEGLAEEGYVV